MVSSLSSTDDELLAQAVELREEADSLLCEKGLQDIVQSAGPACVTGSYSLNLMTWRDLDISVQLQHEIDVSGFFDIGHKIADKFRVVKMTFSNQFIRPDVPFDRGLYWGIRVFHLDGEWHIDLWGFGKDDYQRGLRDFNQLSEQLKEADRLAILRIKDEVCQRPGYRYNFGSLDIYDAVSKHHIKTIKDFDEWLITKGKKPMSETTGDNPSAVKGYRIEKR